MAAFDLNQAAKDAKTAYDKAGDMRWYSDSAKNFVAQYAMAEKANANEIAMWQMQNAYNSPAAQMQRMQEAGLNPMLFYQQGNPGNATSAPGVHVPNATIHPDADRIQKLQAVLAVLSQFNSMVGQAFGVAEKGYDVSLKRNQLAWSNLDYATASEYINNFGRRNASPGYRIIETEGPGGEYQNTLTSSYDPYDPDFSPLQLRLLQRLGVAPYLPRQITAEANAKYSGVRTEYQDYYNKNLLPKLNDYMQGRNDIQGLHKDLLEYEKQVLYSLPPEVRAIVGPIFDYVRPLLNTMLRFRGGAPRRR